MPKSVTLICVMAVTLRYFIEFVKPMFQHITVSICGGIYARVYCILFVVCVRCRRKASSSSLYHLLMSFLFLVCDHSLSVGLCLHDYKFLNVAVMICATLVNTQTDNF